MSKTRPPYSPEFRQRMVALVRAGRTPEELSEEFEPTAMSIRNWVAQAAGSKVSKLKSFTTPDERAELERLRKEVRVLREEREILKKAAAWFAQETGAPSTRRSSS
jgi:transposase